MAYLAPVKRKPQCLKNNFDTRKCFLSKNVYVVMK